MGWILVSEKMLGTTKQADPYMEKRLALWGSPAGKSRVASRVVERLPAHHTYVEPFAGGAAVFYSKPPSEREVLSDNNPEIAFAFKFARDATTEQIATLKKLNWKVSRSQAKAVHEMEPTNPVDRFYRFAYKRYALFFNNDSRITSIDPGKDGRVSDVPDRLERAQERLCGVHIECSEYEKVLNKYDSSETFFYLDPPWPSRKQEVGEEQFDETAFVDQLKKLKGRFLLHYDHKAAKLFHRVKGWHTSTHSITRTAGHTEGSAPGKLLEVRNYELSQTQKQADPYMDVPPENETPYRYTVQQHWRGKSLHADLRIEHVPKKTLIGWTLNTMIAGSVKEPVTTLAQAREAAKDMADISKIDWTTGEWAQRRKRGQGEPTNVAVQSETKPLHPWTWIDVEGATKKQQPGEPPPVGGTKNFPGVFHIVDQGKVEFGAQKPWLHEYFPRGGALNYRVFFRLLKLETKKARESLGVCLTCKSATPDVDVMWANGQARAWFCAECFDAWKAEHGKLIDSVKFVLGDRAYDDKDDHHRPYVSKAFARHADGTSLCFMVPLGKDLAAKFPKSEDAPHVTLLFMGDSVKRDPSTLAKMITAAQDVCAGFGEMELELADEVTYFDPTESSDGKRVAKIEVLCPQLAKLHSALKARLKRDGMDVAHSFKFSAHATLAYIEPGTEYAGKVPAGKWSAKAIELWGYDDPVSLPLGVAKARVLPPSEPGASDEPETKGAVWLMIKPDDQTPYALSDDAVDKGWMPPLGWSALPKAVRGQVPAEHKYWEAKTKGAAKKQRGALFEAVKAGDVELDYEVIRKVEKRSEQDARFVLHEQTWRGPIQIRTGPSRTVWWLRLDVGGKRLKVLRLYRNPLENQSLTAELDDTAAQSRPAAMDFEGDVSPGHYLNPTKDTPSSLAVLDKGGAKFEQTDGVIRLTLEGERLAGEYVLERNDGEWLWQGPDLKVEKSETVTVPIVKVEDEQRLVTGIVLEPGVVDAHNDTVSAEVIQKGAHGWLSKYNAETTMGIMHKKFTQLGIELVESWLAPIDVVINGVKVLKGTWLMTVHITKDQLWRDIKEGRITGFSIGGVATVG